MDDVRHQDRKLFVRELLEPGRLMVSALAIAASLMIAGSVAWFYVVPLLVVGWWGYTGYQASVRKRFVDKRFQAYWVGCQERLAKLEDVMKSMRREQVADLKEVPRTVRSVSVALYHALRRADLIAHEVQKTERGLYQQPPVWSSPSNDAQAKELYRIADKNIAEYRYHFSGVMAGVQRTEAQSAVFMTTVDTLRMKMIGYRLAGRSPEVSSLEFLQALSEAKLQLQAIDRALDELDLSNFPKMIAIEPPVAPGDKAPAAPLGAGDPADWSRIGEEPTIAPVEAEDPDGLRQEP